MHAPPVIYSAPVVLLERLVVDVASLYPIFQHMHTMLNGVKAEGSIAIGYHSDYHGV